MPSVPGSLSFDDVTVDFAGRRLTRAGVIQALEPKAFAVLELLVGSPGKAFSRDDILDAVWGHRHVTQSVLNRVISLLRQALGEDAQNPRLLHTVHGVGYRFDLPLANVAPATQLAAPPPAPVVQSRSPLIIIAAVVALAACAAAVWMIRGNGAATPAPETAVAPSVAVLPFADLSQSHDQEYLADGLAEEIINQLAQVPALRVVGRSSSFSFKGKHEGLRSMGSKLGVAHLLEGSVRKAGDQLRVSAQLIRADDGTQLWSKTYTRELRDVFAVQDEISRDVALALSVKLDVVTFNREQGGTTHVEAYDRYLRWRSIGMRELFDFEHDRERLQLAREMVALDPGCVLCRDALARSLIAVAGEVGGSQAELLRIEAGRVREQLAKLAPDSWVAKRDRSNALWREGKRVEAVALARDIADSGPTTKERVWDYAYMIYALGYLNETVALVEQVRAVEPRALFLSRDLQFDYTAARRYDDAEAEYRRGLTVEGNQFEPTYVAFFRQMAGKRLGGLAELRALHRQLTQQDKKIATPFFRDLGEMLGDRQAMLSLVRSALAHPDHASGEELAFVWVNVADALGDADLAVAGIRKVLETQEGFSDGAMAQFPYVFLWNAPYSSVRSHPDFKKLLIDTGVVAYWRQTGRWGDGCGPVGVDDFQCR